MTSTPDDSDPPNVPLPADQGRNIEAVHALAWRHLLETHPGTLQALADEAALQLGGTAEALGEGTTISPTGHCGSDLFVICQQCGGDRAVLELKGPKAWVNWLKTKNTWQTIHYRETYRANPPLACHHLRLPGPLLILLDAKNRTRQVIEQTEGRGEPFLDGWAVLRYEQVLSRQPFSSHRLAAWLLGR